MDFLSNMPPFLWAGGFENTFIPHSRPGLRPMDQYALTQHYEQWRADLDRAASLGIKTLRWGVPWYRVEPQPGVFTWDWIDTVLDYMVQDLRIQPIIDLMHYGTPLWLEESFAHPDYPDRVAAYAATFAQRYHHLVQWYTPLNEPTVNAEFCGRKGLWPPYLTGEAGYVHVLLQLARGMQETAKAIRAVNPRAVLVAVESMGWRQPQSEQAESLVMSMDLMDFLAWDLVRGSVDAEHGLFDYMIGHGASLESLQRLQTSPIEHDIFGVNFYPWAAHRVDISPHGTPVVDSVPRNGMLLADVLRRCHHHVQRPLMITETSAREDVLGRAEWMDETIAAVRMVQQEAIPVIGYTWFPLISMIDWQYRQTDQPVADHLLHLGLWDATVDDSGHLARYETALVAKYRQHVMGHSTPATPSMALDPGIDDPPLPNTTTQNVTQQTITHQMGGINFGTASIDTIGTIHVHAAPARSPDRIPMMANRAPSDEFVMRAIEYQRIVDYLLDAATPTGSPMLAIYGLGGNGKTSLANAVCYDPRVRGAFPDGILWATLGEAPNVMIELAKMYAAFTGERPAFIDEEDANHSVAMILANKRCLLVIDDVWNATDLQAFRFGEVRLPRLITTRKAALIPAAAQRMMLEGMKTHEAIQLLSNGIANAAQTTLQQLVAVIGQWPLLLKLANGVLHQFIATHNSLEEGSMYVRQALHHLGPIALDDVDADRRDQAVSLTLDASLKLLSRQHLERYIELAIFPDDIPIPLVILERLWAKTGKLHPIQVEQLCLQFVSQSLVHHYHSQHRIPHNSYHRASIQLHDIVRKYIAHTYASRLPSIHAALLASYEIEWWWQIPANDTYMWHQLPYHLLAAGRKHELRALLGDYEWIRAKLNATSVPDLLNDYACFADDPELQCVHEALQLSAYSLVRDKRYLRSQLYSRLLLQEADLIVRLRTQIQSSATSGWLRTLLPSLEPIGGREICTMSGHIKGVTALALFHNSYRAISAADDGMVKVWDLASGTELFTLGQHSDEARGVTVVPGDEFAISTGGDAVLKVWDLRTRTEVQTLQGHRRTVRAVVVTPNGRHIISASDDWTLKVWDLSSGAELYTLEGHTQRVVDLALIPGTNYVASAADDHTIKIWDLDQRQAIQTLIGHADMVRAIAISPDGYYAVSGSDDATIKVWDWRQGVELRTLKGHMATVWCVAITADGRNIYSGSRDCTIRAWDLESGLELHTFTGHTDMVRSVKILEEQQHILSASNDFTIRIWAMESKQELRTLVRHTTMVNTAIFTPDGRRAISASQDTTIKVWDVAMGNEPQNLRGHAGPVRALCVFDNHTVISGSNDTTIRIWDIDTGETRAVLEGHTRAVLALALIPGGQYIVSGSADWSLNVWDLRTGKAVASFIGESAIVTCNVAADGRTIVAGEQFGRVHLLKWELPASLTTLT